MAKEATAQPPDIVAPQIPKMVPKGQDREPACRRDHAPCSSLALGLHATIVDRSRVSGPPSRAFAAPLIGGDDRGR